MVMMAGGWYDDDNDDEENMKCRVGSKDELVSGLPEYLRSFPVRPLSVGDRSLYLSLSLDT